MELTIAGTYLPHQDPADSRAFYEGVLGFEVRNDVEYAGMHWITVGPKGQPGIAIVLYPPEADPGVTEEERRVSVLAARHRLANLLEDCQADQVPIRVESLAGREGLEAIRYSQENSADLLIVPAPERDQSTVLERLFPRGTDLTLLNLPCALLAWRPRRTP